MNVAVRTRKQPLVTADHELLRFALAIGTGFSFGLLLFSFIAVAVLMSERGNSYVAFMEALGSFIGGTLQALALMAVGWGLLLQSRNIREDRALAADNRRWEYFGKLLELFHERGSALECYLPDDETPDAPSGRTLKGVSGTEHAIRQFDCARGNNIKVDWTALTRFVELNDRLVFAADQITDKERRSDAQSLVESSRCPLEIRRVLRWRADSKEKVLSIARAAGLSTADFSALSRLLDVVNCLQVDKGPNSVVVRVLPADGGAWISSSEADEPTSLRATITRFLPIL